MRAPGRPSIPFGGVSAIIAHPTHEDVFFSVCDKKVLGWKIKDSAWDECVPVLHVNAHNSLPLSTCHLASEGAFLYTCARDLAMPTPQLHRTEDSVKVWSVNTGRCLATLSLGQRKAASQSAADMSSLAALSSSMAVTALPGPVFTALSPDERVVASAIIDGSIMLHYLDPLTLPSETGRPPPSTDANEPDANSQGVPFVAAVVQPSRVFSAFQDLASSRIISLKFSFDSALLAAVGNVRQVKVWYTISPGKHPLEGAEVEAGEATRRQMAVQPPHQSKRPASESMAEFLMEQTALCLDWTPNPAEDGCEMVVGDAMGKVHCLRLRR